MGGKRKIPKERRFCFGSNGIEGFNNIIPGGQVGKAGGNAWNRRVKSPAPKIPLRAINADRRNPGHRLAEIKSVGALKG